MSGEDEGQIIHQSWKRFNFRPSSSLSNEDCTRSHVTGSTKVGIFVNKRRNLEPTISSPKKTHMVEMSEERKTTASLDTQKTQDELFQRSVFLVTISGLCLG